MKLIKLKRNNGCKSLLWIRNEFFTYDKVVLASHADESLKIISDATDQEKKY
jgi:predicted NAD/FAD-binding protein